MKKTIFILWLLFCHAYLSNSQNITITNQESQEALEMVSLISREPQLFAITNVRGQADITAFSESEQIEIRLLGFETIILSYEEIAAKSFQLTLTPSYFNIDEIVISANKWEQVSNHIPEKIISIPVSELRLQNPQTAADLLSISGKVFVQKSQQGGGSPMIRGFATNRLLYTIDGVRMNTAIYRGGNIQNVISLDAFSLIQTEILFGPGSVIYGSDAIGGVMNFTTLVPQLSLNKKSLITGSAVSRYSSANNENTYHFDISLGWKKWALASSITSSNFGDLKMGSHGPDEYLLPYYVERQDSVDIIVTNQDPKVQQPSGYSQINMMQKIRFKPNNFWDFNFGFHYSETSDYARYDRHIRYKNGLPRYGEWYYGPQKWMMNNLNIAHTKTTLFFDKMTLQLAQQYFEESRISRDINKNNRERRTEQVNAYSINLDFSKEIGQRNNLSYGIEYILNHINSTGINENIETGLSEIGPSRYPQSDWTSYAAYVTNSYQLSEKAHLKAGARYSQYILNAIFDTTFYAFPFTEANIDHGALTGSIGIVYQPTASWIMSTNLSTAFRSPNVDDLGKVFDSEPGSVVVPNPNLEAEYAYNADVSITKVISKTIKIDFTAYYTLLNNALVRRDYLLNGMDSILYDGEMSKVQAIQNAAQANVFGVQAGFEIKLPSGFGLSSDFNYQKGIEELDDGSTSPSRHAPPFYGNTALTYSANKLSLHVYAIYSGEKSYEDMPESEKSKDYMYATDENGNPYSPAWYTVNFKAMYQFAEHFSLSAGIENITDQRYRPYSSGIVAPGRNFVLSLRANF